MQPGLTKSHRRLRSHIDLANSRGVVESDQVCRRQIDIASACVLLDPASTSGARLDPDAVVLGERPTGCGLG